MISVSINDFIGLKVGDKFNNLSIFTDQPYPGLSVSDWNWKQIEDEVRPGTYPIDQQFLKAPFIVPIGTLFEVVYIHNFVDAKHVHFTYISDGVEYSSWFSVGSLNSRSCFMNFRVNNLEKLGI